MRRCAAKVRAAARKCGLVLAAYYAAILRFISDATKCHLNALDHAIDFDARFDKRLSHFLDCQTKEFVGACLQVIGPAADRGDAIFSGPILPFDLRTRGGDSCCGNGSEVRQRNSAQRLFPTRRP